MRRAAGSPGACRGWAPADLPSTTPNPACSQGKVQHYVFVGSAGAYKADGIEPCHFEGDARKASAGHVEVGKGKS